MKRLLLAFVSLIFSISLSYSQAIVITSPSTSQSLTGCSSYLVTFTGSGTTFSYIGAEYSINNGATWLQVGVQASFYNVQSIVWNVPNISGTAILRVKNYFSTSIFSTVGGLNISPTANAPKFKITSPIYSSNPLSYQAGNNLGVSWDNNFTSCVPYVKLELSTNGGGSWNLITTSTPNVGSFGFNLPNVQTSNGLIRVSDALNSSNFDISDEFSISAGGTFLITNPAGGSSWVGCSTPTVVLATNGYSNGSGFYASIDLSTNSGVSWNSLNSFVYFYVTNGVAASNFSIFNVPGIVTSNARIRIKDNNTLFTASSTSDFSITPGNPTISNLTPTAGTAIYQGNSPSLGWTSSTFCIPNIKIDYSTDNGSTWINTYSGANNNYYYGSFASITSTINSSNFLIRVSDATNSSVSVINSYVVKPRSLSITSPVATSNWAACTSRTINWTFDGTGNYFQLDYSTNSGINWSSITSSSYSGSSPATFTWNVPNIVSSNMSIRVRDVSTPSISSTSANFSIIASPSTITSVSLNSSYSIGSSAQVYWNYSAGCAPSAVKIEFSNDNGSTYTTLNANYSSGSPFNWTVVGPSASQCKIKVTDVNNSLSFAVSNVFSIVSPSITFNGPTLGSILPGCTSQTISINASGTSYYYSYDYSIDGGASWTFIASYFYNTGSVVKYSWAVPNINSSNVLVRVRDSQNLSIGGTSAGFSITASTVTSPVVTTPSTTTSWNSGSSNYIYWNSNTGCAPNVKLEYSLDNGSTWNTIISSTINYGSYYWSPVPNVNGIISTAKIRVTDLQNSLSGINIGTFTINGGSLTFTSPSALTSITGCAASSFNIGLSLVGAAAGKQYDLEYTVDNGVTWNIIERTPIISSSYSKSWNVPNVSASNAKIRATEYGNPSKVYFSPTFVINAGTSAITNVSPTSVVSYNAGTSQFLTWTSGLGCVQKVKIEYSTDGGTTWKTVVNRAVNLGYYSWNVPSDPSTNCKIRVSDANNLATTGISSTFTIIGGATNKSIVITTPSSSTIWNGCSTQFIYFNSTGVSTVKVEFSKDNGVTWSTLSDNYGSSSNYYYPNVSNISTSTAKIKITDLSTGTVIGVSAAFTINSVPASFSVIQPATGGFVNNSSSSAYSINWSTSSSCSIPFVKLEYSIDNGSNWYIITSQTNNSGSYSWIVPSTLYSNQALIKVSDASNLSLNTVSGIFSIGLPSISVLSPMPGDLLAINSNANIQWIQKGISSNFYKIEYSINGGASWTYYTNVSCATSTCNTTFNTGSTTTNNAFVRVSDYNNQGIFGTNPLPFSIGNPTVTITSPIGGETLTSNSSQTVTWIRPNAFSSNSYIGLEYSLNGGTSWTTYNSAAFATYTGNNGSYTWTVPNVSSTNALVRVTIYGTSSIGVSPNVFTIGNQTISTSYSSSTICSGSPLTVNYTLGGTGSWISGNVFIAQLSDVNGNFASGTLNIGSVSGTTSGSIAALIPSTVPLSSIYRVRVISTNPVIQGTPGSYFYINNCISVANITGIPCRGIAGNVPFTATGTYLPGNVFTAVMSNSAGSFASGTSILGTTTIAGASSMQIVIPGGVTSSSNYLIRIQSSNPSITGTQTLPFNLPNSDCMVASTITSGLVLCNASPILFNIGFASGYVLNPGNQTFVDLSNSVGDFSSPTTIFSTTSTATSGTLGVTIPSGMPQGTGYRYRVRTTSPYLVSAASNPFTLNNVCIGTQTITGSPCIGGDIVISVPVTGAISQSNYYFINIFNSASTYIGSVYYDWPGGFTVSPTGTTSGIKTFTFKAPTAGSYYFQVGAGDGVYNVSASNLTSPLLTVSNCINTPTVSLPLNCAGSPTTISFTSNNTFSGSNVFVAEIANSTSFTSPLVVGTTLGTGIGTTSISGIIPSSLPQSTYYIRIKASENGAVSPSSSGFSITQLCFGVPTVSGGNCFGSPISVTVPVSGSVNPGNSYTVKYFNSNPTPTYLGDLVSVASTSTGLLTFTGTGITSGSYYFRVEANSPLGTSGYTTGLFNINNCISNPVLASSYCASSPFVLPFTTTQPYNSGNIFIAELSNDNFATAFAIGSITGNGGTSPATTISGFIPSTLVSGNYNVRIRGTNPVSLSLSNNMTLINQVCIGTPTVTGALCLGNILNVVVPVSGSVNPANVYSINLYNGSNNLVNVVGTLTSNATGLISIQMPTTLLGIVTGFKVGVVASNPSTVGTPLFSNPFSINQCISTPPTPTSGQCAGSSFPIVFTTTNTFSGSNTFSAELIVNDNYSNPVIIGSALGSGGTNPATTISGLLPSSVSGGASYKIRIKASSPLATGYTTGGFNINQLCISQPTLASSFSFDSPGIVTVTVNGAADPSNVFSVELSNISSTGFSASPIILGSLTTNSFGVLNIPIKIPASGAGSYVVRVKASSPASTSVSPSVAFFSITGKAITQPIIPPASICAGDPLAVSIPVDVASNANFGIGNVFIAELSNASAGFGSPVVIGSISGVSNVTISGFIPAGTPAGTQYKIRIRSTNFVTISDASIGSLTINPICITGGSISGISCYGAPLNVPFSVYGTANAGNVYTASLFDNLGNPYALVATLTSTSVGQLGISAVIPSGLNTSRSYRFSISASNPLTTAVAASYTNFFPVAGNCILSPNVAITSVCAGTPLNVNIPVNVVTSFNTNNQFTAELSNSAGNFAAATVIGSVLATGNATISGVIPANLPTGGNYQIRIKANDWLSTSSPSSGFTINQLCITPASITGPYCNQQPASLSFNVSGVTNSATVYSVELYEYYWNFSQYVNGSRGIIGTITTASVGNLSIPVSFPSVGYTGSQYRVIFRSSNPLANADYSNFFTINGNCINTPIVTGGNNACSAAPISVNISFTSPATFAGGNVFIAELSNAAGLFTSPTVIGSVSGLVGTSLTGVVPANLPSGNYSLRVRSTSWVSSSSGSAFFNTNALCITNSVSGTYCKGQPITVNFTVNGIIGGGNVYTVQLSDRFGNFGSPTNLGTYNTSVGGDLTLTTTVPSSLIAGSGYRTRVIASNPASTGYDNGQNITINDYCISAPAVASYYCVGTPINLTLPVVASAGFAGGNVFIAELSDKTGSFTNSSIFGFVSATTSTSMAATLPANLPSGTGYQIRIRSSAFPIIGQATNAITIDQLCISTNSITGTFCNNNNDLIQIGFDVVGQPNAGTTYNAQLIRNTFGTVYNLGSITSGATSGLSINSTITSSLPAGGYTVRVVSSNPISTGSINGNVNVLGSCQIGTPSPLPTICTANSVSGTLFVNAGVGTYSGGNLFVAELSDASGSFVSPITIGSVASTFSTTLTYNIPSDLVTGNNYAVRIKSTTGTPTPSNSSSPFTINKACLSTGSVPNTTPYCAGDGLGVSVTVTGSIDVGNVYTAQISDASGNFSNPINIGTLSSASAGLVTVPSIIPIGTPDGYGYRVRVIGSNSGSQSIANGSISIRQVCVTTSSISQTTYCTGTQITVPFLANATANPGNRFILELSDANGNFTNGSGFFIGTQLNDVAGVSPTSITGIVPFGTPNGTLYKVRIRATNPSTIGVVSPDPLTIDNTYRWIGGNTTTGTAIEWKNPNNWSCGFVPTAGNDAIIPASTVGNNFPEINDLTAVVRTLYIENGATVINLSSGKLTLYGSLVHDGSLVSTSNSPVVFAGTSVQSISGVGALTFGKLSISNISSGVKTYIPFSLTGDFENNGYFDPNGKTVRFSGASPQFISGNQLTTFFGMQLNNTSGVNLLNDIYVKGNFVNSGTFNGISKLTLFNGAPVQTISASGGSFTNFYDIQFGNFGNPAGVYINDNINVLGNFTRVLGNFTCSPSATIFFIGNSVPQVVDAGGVNITFNDINMSNPFGVTLSTGTSFSLVGDFINTGKFYSPFTSNVVTFGGNSPQSLSGGGLYSFSNLVINPSATVTFNNQVGVSADFTVNGTLIPNGSTVTFNNNGNQFINGLTPVSFSNLEIVPTSFVYPTVPLTFDGNVTNSGSYFASTTAPGFTILGSSPQVIGGSGTYNLVNLTNTNSVGGVTFNSTFDIDGNIVNNGTFLSGPLSMVTFSGLVPQSISGLAPVNFNDIAVVNNSSVTVTNNMNVQGDFLNNNSVPTTSGFNFVNNTVAFNGSGLQSLGGMEPTLFSSISFNNLAGVKVETSLSVGGVSFVNDGLLNCTSGTAVAFTSLVPQTIGGVGAINFADVVFANSNTVSGAQLNTGVNVAGDFLNISGFNANTNPVVFNGFAQTINNSPANQNPTFATISVAGTSTVTLNDTINTKGNFLIGGSFNANLQPVVFNGGNLQTIDGVAPIQFADVTFGNASGFAVNQTASVSSVSFDSGILTMEPGNVFAVTSTTPSSVDRQTGYVVGPIARAVEQPIGQFLFPVGTPTDYRGATIDFSNSAGLSGGVLVTHQELSPTSSAGFISAITTTTPNVFFDIDVNGDSVGYTKVYAPVWTITPSTSISGANYSVNFAVSTAQIFQSPTDSVTNANVNDLRIVKRPDSGGKWQFLGTNGLATISGGVLSISRSSLGSFSQFAVAGSCNNSSRSSAAISVSLINTTDSLTASYDALSYRWYKDAVQLPFTTKKIKGVSAGNYSVQANLSGCFTNSSNPFSFTPSAVNTQIEFTSVKMFPNPTSGDLTIEFTNVKKEVYNLSLINSVGVEVWKTEVLPTDEKFWKSEFSLNELASGVYFVKIAQGKNVVFEKLVIQK